LTALILKEIKELIRDPKIILGVILMPLLIFPVMGTAVQISQESIQKAIITASFAVYSEDTGIVNEALLDYLYTNNSVVPIEATNLEEALKFFQESDSNALVYIPQGYSDNVSMGIKGFLKVYANLKNLNMAETQSTSQVSRLINIYSYYFSLNRIESLIS
jgi:ABC-2 type transport system permease protein